MPLYEYQCEACGHRFEVIQKFSDAALESCPKCAGAVRKLLSSSAIQFKGSGWYVTDYARTAKADGSAPPKSDASTEGAEKKTEAPAESKSEAKTEAKTESKPSTPSTS